MKKGENKIQTDFVKLLKFARLVNAMRRAQKRVGIYELYDKPEKKKEALEAAGQYEKSVDYMIERILG